jgi:hypothetical protein
VKIFQLSKNEVQNVFQSTCETLQKHSKITVPKINRLIQLQIFQQIFSLDPSPLEIGVAHSAQNLTTDFMTRVRSPAGAKDKGFF